jgi:hypothetical protein
LLTIIIIKFAALRINEIPEMDKSESQSDCEMTSQSNISFSDDEYPDCDDDYYDAEELPEQIESSEQDDNLLNEMIGDLSDDNFSDFNEDDCEERNVLQLYRFCRELDR